MPLNTVNAERPTEADVVDAVRELQRLRQAVVVGAAAATDIPVAGLEAEDSLVSVIELAGPGEAAGTPAAVDRTADTTVPADGVIRVAVATNTTVDRRLVVTFFAKD